MKFSDFIMLILFSLCLTTVSSGFAAEETKLTGESIAKTLLDVDVDVQKRRDLFAAHPEIAADIVRGLVKDLPVGTDEEYIRIPWIWRVSIAATKRLDTEQIKQLLEISLPEDGKPLYDWQAVVIGGAVINGFTLSGKWPVEALQPIFKEEPILAKKWVRSMELAKKMSDDTQIKNGTRYDALRMLGMLNWKESGKQLVGYLQPDIDNELKQGAIGGLADLNAPEAGPALLSGWEYYTDKLKYFVVEAMLRTPERFALFKEQIEAEKINIEFLGDEQMDQLENHPHEITQANAQKLLEAE